MATPQEQMFGFAPRYREDGSDLRKSIDTVAEASRIDGVAPSCDSDADSALLVALRNLVDNVDLPQRTVNAGKRRLGTYIDGDLLRRIKYFCLENELSVNAFFSQVYSVLDATLVELEKDRQ